MSNKDQYQPETREDVEAEDELFGEVIEQSDAHIDDVNVMAPSDLSEASSPHGSSIPLATRRRSDHAGVTDADRPHAAAPKSSASSGIGVTVVLVAVVLVGLYLLTMGGNEPAPSTGETAPVAQTDDGAKAPAKAPIEAEPDDGRGDGTPTLDADTLSKGMVAAGWKVGPASTSTLDEVKQTNVLASKGDMASTVAIYESKTWDWANTLLLETEPPAQGISFGRTVVRISPGPAAQQNGVLDLMGALADFKKAARAKAEGEAGTPAE